MSVDAAKATLDSILPDLDAAFRDLGSEQDVRLKIINRVLIEVCGWEYEQIKTEVTNDHGFADYALRDAKARTVCVLEAKKAGKLIIDTASMKKLEVQVGGSVLKRAKEGIDQAVGYCVETSCSYAAVTDGQSWVFFRLRTDGLPFREGKAIVFLSNVLLAYAACKRNFSAKDRFH
jgi:predicted type IV restriction endonuclease